LRSYSEDELSTILDFLNRCNAMTQSYMSRLSHQVS
jgi:hypothetical protein